MPDDQTPNDQAPDDELSSQDDIDRLLASAGLQGDEVEPLEEDVDVDALLARTQDLAGQETSEADEFLKAMQADGPPAEASSGSAAADLLAALGGQGAQLELEDFGDAPEAKPGEKNFDLLMDVNLNLKVELGRTRMALESILRLGEGSVVELDKLAGDPLEILVNDRPVARGEVLVLNENFCVRITEIIEPEDRVKKEDLERGELT